MPAMPHTGWFSQRLSSGVDLDSRAGLSHVFTRSGHDIEQLFNAMCIGMFTHNVIVRLLRHARAVRLVPEPRDCLIDVRPILLPGNILDVWLQDTVVIAFKQDLAGFCANRFEMTR